MRTLHQHQLDSLHTERIERKFMMSQGQSHNALAILLNFGFSPSYPNRRVTSLYFDDIEFSSLAANIEGVPSRDKLRARYYDDLPGNVTIEIKHRRSHLGFKSSYPMKHKAETMEQLVSTVENWCHNNVVEKLFPTAHVRYERSYYVHEQFRLTLDQKICSGRWSGGEELSSSLCEYEVIEFKYPLNLDQDFRLIFPYIDKFSLRNTKSSKYSNALMW